MSITLSPDKLNIWTVGSYIAAFPLFLYAVTKYVQAKKSPVRWFLHFVYARPLMYPLSLS